MSALSAQLKAIALQNPDAIRLGSSKSSKQKDSYLYTPRQAAGLTLDDVHVVGLQGLQGLTELDGEFERFRRPLFGEGTKRLDRTLIDTDENLELNKQLDAFLRAIGPHLLIKPSAKALEWLIRRFRINEFNVLNLLAVFLPYHETPQFASMLQILQISKYPFLSFLEPVKLTREPLPRTHLTDAIISSGDLLRWVVDILPSMLRSDSPYIHRALVGFHLTTSLAAIEALSVRSLGFSDAAISAILPMLRDGLTARSNSEVQLATYVITSAFAQRAPVSHETSQGILNLVASSGKSRPKEAVKRTSDSLWADVDEALVRTLILVHEALDDDSSPLTLDGKPIEHVSHINGVAEMLAKLVTSFNVGRFWPALVAALCAGVVKGLEVQGDLLRSLASLPTLGVKLSTELAREVFKAISTIDEPPSALLKALDTVGQRHVGLLDTVSSEIVQDQPQVREVVTRTLRLAHGGIQGDGTSDEIIDLGNTNAVVRCAALDRLLSSAQPVTDDSRKSFIAATIKNALLDFDANIAQTLLVSHPKSVMKHLTATELFGILCDTFNSPSLPRATLRLRLAFFTGPFLTEEPHKRAPIAEEISKRLLWVKSSAKGCAVIWEAVSSANSSSWKGTMLEGIRSHETCVPNSSEAVKLNRDTIQLLASNLAKFKDAETIRRWILSATETSHSQPSTRLLALQILASPGVAKQLSPSDLLNFALSLLRSISASQDGPNSIAGIPIDAPSMSSTMEKVYSKSGSDKTLTLVSGMALKPLMDAVKRPEGTEFVWTDNTSRLTPEAKAFKQFVAESFEIASAGDEQHLGHFVYHLLMDQLCKSDCLSLLASLWTDLQKSTRTRCNALEAAHREISKHRLDYQLLIPPILVAIIDTSREVRVAALVLVEKMHAYYSGEAFGTDAVYGYDAFYGSQNSKDLRYLDAAECQTVLQAIYGAKEEILMDGTFIQPLLEDRLGKPSTGKTKDKMKHNFLCFAMAAAVSWKNIEARSSLLECLSGIRDSGRLPLACYLVKNFESDLELMMETPSSLQIDRYAEVLFSAYSHLSKRFLHGKDPESFSLIINTLKTETFTRYGNALRSAGFARLEKTLFSALALPHKQEILDLLLNCGNSSRSDAVIFIRCFRALKLDAKTVIALLQSLTNPVTSSAPKVSKKAKTSAGPIATRIGDIGKLSLALENLDLTATGASKALCDALIDVLSILLDANSRSPADVHFPAQLVITALSIASSKLLETGELASAAQSLQLRPILDYMRISPNPYVAQQAISLLSDVAIAAPNQAVHTAMPILTFIGANVLQRDDAASARTVEKVIQSLIPPIVERINGKNRIDSILELKDLLQVFTGAAVHIPRHRRIRVFVPLLETLGVYNFLGAMLAILIQVEHDDEWTGEDFSLTLWESFPARLELAALAHLATEVDLLLDSSASTQQSIILAPTKIDDDHPMQDASPTIEDAQEQQRSRDLKADMLIVFILEALTSRSLAAKLEASRSAGDQEGDQVLSHFIRLLIDLRQARSELSPERSTSIGNVTQIAATLMSPSSLSDAMSDLLSREELVCAGLALIEDYLPTMKSSGRAEMASCTLPALRLCSQTIESLASSREPLVPLKLAINTIQAVCQNSTNAEQAVLADICAPMIRLIESSGTHGSSAMGALEAIIRSIGTRVVPYIGSTITTCSQIIRNGKMTDNLDMKKSVYRVLDAVVVSVPFFIGPHLDPLVGLIARTAGSKEEHGIASLRHKSPLQNLVNSIVRLVKLSEVVEAVKSNWNDGLPLPKKTCLMDILHRKIKACKSPEVTPMSKSVFNTLLTSLDTRRLQSSSNSDLPMMLELESLSLSAFLALTLKLSEASFKPLLLKSIDWAFVDLGSGRVDPADSNTIDRRIVFFKLMSKTLSQLRVIAVPFFGFCLDHISELLEAFVDGRVKNSELWCSTMASLRRALENDTMGWWTFTRLGKVTRNTVCQLTLVTRFGEEDIQSHLVPLIARLAVKLTTHDTLLKVLNTSLLQQIRSEQIKVKRVALMALDAVWKDMGESLVTFVPETVGAGLAEALDEAQGEVDVVARRVLNRIENEVGDIDGYLA